MWYSLLRSTPLERSSVAAMMQERQHFRHIGEVRRLVTRDTLEEVHQCCRIDADELIPWNVSACKHSVGDVVRVLFSCTLDSL